MIALTAIASNNSYRPGGSLRSTHVMHNDWSKREKDIHDIIIRNVIAHSYLCYVVRLLPAMASVYNVVIDGVIDTQPNQNLNYGGTILLGCDDGEYGKNERDDMRNIFVSNVSCNSRYAIEVAGFLTDSVITNVVNRNPKCETFKVDRENGLNNVSISNVIATKV